MSRLRYHPVAPSLVAASARTSRRIAIPLRRAARLARHLPVSPAGPPRAPVGRRLPVNFVDFIREA